MIFVDSWLIARFEAFCHFTQKLIDTRAATWFRLSLAIAIGFVLAKELPVDKATGLVAGDYFITLWLSLMFMTSFLPEHRGAGFMNPEKIRHRRLRPISLVLAVMGSYPMLAKYGSLSGLFMCIGWYFDTCDDLPPGESRLRKAIKDIRAFGKLVALPTNGDAN